MKFLVMAALILAAGASEALDVGVWLEKREMFAREAERLQVAYTNCRARIDAPAEGVKIPLETYADGSVKLIASARRAQLFLDAGFVWAEGVVIRRLEPDGSEESRVEADSCLFDRNTKSGWVQGTGRIVHGKTTFTGEGLYFSSPEGYFSAARKTRIVTTDLKTGGVL